MFWEKYNYSINSKYPPHVEITKKQLLLAKKLMNKNGCLFIRYTSNFDKEKIGNWWYLIKENTPTTYSSKTRYEIRKGEKHCYCKIIDAYYYKEELYRLYYTALRGYRIFRKKILKRSKFYKSISNQYDVWGIFLISTNHLVGYALIKKYSEYVDYENIKYDRKYLKYGISALLIKTLNEFYFMDKNIKYVTDGQRSFMHKTNIQEYLIKYFEFRKAYCRLNIIYSRKMIYFIKVLRIVNKIIRLNKIEFINKIFEVENIRYT